MTDILLGFVVGLVVGWNFFPQPGWVKSFFNQLGLGKGKVTINVDTKDDSNTA